MDPQYVFEDVIANPWATAVVECMLGPSSQLRFYSANMAFKATGRQPPLIDVDFDFPKVPIGYCININLVDTSAGNGATEVWLGSHTDNKVLDHSKGPLMTQVHQDLQQERRKISPPIQPSLSKGALIIRTFDYGMPECRTKPTSQE